MPDGFPPLQALDQVQHDAPNRSVQVRGLGEVQATATEGQTFGQALAVDRFHRAAQISQVMDAIDKHALPATIEIEVEIRLVTQIERESARFEAGENQVSPLAHQPHPTRIGQAGSKQTGGLGFEPHIVIPMRNLKENAV